MGFFIALWGAGIAGVGLLGLPGVVFMSYEAVLTVILILMIKFKSA